jgi:hypothetical protein
MIQRFSGIFEYSAVGTSEFKYSELLTYDVTITIVNPSCGLSLMVTSNHLQFAYSKHARDQAVLHFEESDRLWLMLYY